MTKDLDRAKLAKLCAQFSSDDPDVVVDAARCAHVLVRASGQSWSTVFNTAPHHPNAEFGVEPDHATLEAIDLCLKHPKWLCGNEARWLLDLRDLVDFLYDLDDGQRARLEQIRRRVLDFESEYGAGERRPYESVN
jgi:hypothetical protein